MQCHIIEQSAKTIAPFRGKKRLPQITYAQYSFHLRYLKQLDVQLIEKQSERDVAYMEFLQEKRLIDEVIAKVKAEQRKARIEAVVKKEVLKEDVHRFMEAQEVFVRMEKERTERENSRILEFVDHKDKWTIDQEAIEAERRKFKHGAVSKLAEEMGRTQKEVLEKEEILHELHEGRMRDEERRREADEMTRELRKRLAFKESNEAAVAYREMVKERERAKDEEWRRKWIEEMEAKERLEQMSDAKRRMKRLELKREVERIMAERQVEREIEKLDEARFWQEQKEREAEMDRVVEEERMRMLKAHASRLVGHLPGGIIKEEDLDHLGEEVRMAFRKRPRYRDPLECLEEQYK
jgi:hypothetical protein